MEKAENTGTIRQVVPMTTTGAPERWRGYLGVAEHLLHGVRQLGKAYGPCGMACLLVASHTLELALKAYPALKGGPGSKPDTSHDLLELWARARQAGLDLPDRPPEWAQQLARLRGRPFLLRYAEGVHGLVAPPFEPMASELEELVKHVRSSIAADQARTAGA